MGLRVSSSVAPASTGLSPEKKKSTVVFLATPFYIPRVVRKSLCRQDKKQGEKTKRRQGGKKEEKKAKKKNKEKNRRKKKEKKAEKNKATVVS